MAISTWVYDKTTGRFLYGGFYTPSFDSGTQAVAMFNDWHPDPTRDKWDAVNNVIVAVTPAEMTSDAATVQATQADADGARRGFAACVYYTLRVSLGRNPTPAEFAAGLVVWKTIYKALP